MKFSIFHSLSLQETSKAVNGGCPGVLQRSNRQRVPHSTQGSRVFKMVGHTYSDTCTILEAAGESISLITKTAIKRKAKEILYQHQGEYWNSTLTPLEVHSTTSSSLNPNHGPSLSKQHVLSKLSKISISKLGYLLANCYFSSGPVQIAYQPPLTSYAGTIESVTNARYATLPLPCQPIS